MYKVKVYMRYYKFIYLFICYNIWKAFDFKHTIRKKHKENVKLGRNKSNKKGSTNKYVRLKSKLWFK